MNKDKEKLFKSISICQETGCWNWIGHIEKNGYGRFCYKGKSKWAHRCAYQIIVGEIPSGLELDHLCKNTRCVNPNHLEPVSHRENMKRAGFVLAKLHKAKTHCPQGHPYSGVNLVVWNNQRFCRICQTKYKRNYEESKKSHSKQSFKATP